MGTRKVNRLSVKTVESKLAPGYYRDGDGLILQVSKAGTKSWIFQYQLNGRIREMGLGPLGKAPPFTITLAAARERAAKCRQLLVDHIDPIGNRDAERAQRALAAANTKTFSECVSAYLKAKRKGWTSEKHSEQWTQTLKDYAEPVFGSLAVQDVATAHVVRALEPMWIDKAPTARRVRMRVESVLDWAKAHGYRTGENPARWRDHLKNLLPAQPAKHVAVKHHPALPYEQIGQFIVELRKQPGVAPLALELTILTALRTREVAGAAWDEFDLNAGVWTVPAERMKGKLEHRVPLAPRVVQMLRDLKDAAGPGARYVFRGRARGSHLGSAAMLKMLNVTMERTDITVHGFRSTFRDWAGESTNYPRDVCETALAHAIGNDVERSYRRGDFFEKRRRLMNDWAAYCETTKRGDVVPLRKGAA